MHPDHPGVRNTQAWTTFTIASFLVAAFMMAAGIFFMEASFSSKGFHAMAALMLVHTTVSITKTLRDNEESKKLINRIEDAKTERLLMEVNKAA